MNANIALKGLKIDYIALKKIEYFTKLAPGEVSGLGLIEEINGEFLVKDVYLFQQTNGAASTEMNPQDIASFIGDLVRAEKEDLIPKFKFWWHSHGKIDLMWSATDEETINTLSDEYSFSLVTNKSRQYLVRCDIYKPFRITLNQVPLIVEEPENFELLKRCKKELDEKTFSFKLLKRKKKDLQISTDIDEKALKELMKNIEGEEDGRKFIYPPAGPDQSGEATKYSNYNHRGGSSRLIHSTSTSKDGR